MKTMTEDAEKVHPFILHRILIFLSHTTRIEPIGAEPNRANPIRVEAKSKAEDQPLQHLD
jgi:hypothetical protein